MRNTYAPLTTAQLHALEDYAYQHGRQWKMRLREDWFDARTSGTLHALRNTHGPSWLADFMLRKPKIAVVCNECFHKFSTINDIPYCPKCGGADIDPRE